MISRRTIFSLVAAVLAIVALASTATAQDTLVCAESGPTSVTLSYTPESAVDEVEFFLHGLSIGIVDGPLTAGVTVEFEAIDLTVPQAAFFCAVGRSGGSDNPAACCVIALEVDPAIESELLPAAPISSAEPPYLGFFFFADALVIEDLQLDVEVDHPDRSRVDVSLTSPAGTTVLLHDGRGDGAGLDLTYWELGVPNGFEPHDCACLPFPTGPGRLADLAGESIGAPGGGVGVWVVSVASNTFSGTVDRLALRAYDTQSSFAPLDLSCEVGVDPLTAELTWTHASDYDSVEVFLGATLFETLDGPFVRGESGSYTTPPLDLPLDANFVVRGVIGNAHSPAFACSVELPIDPIAALGCASVDGDRFEIEWENTFPYDEIALFVDGVETAILDGATTSYTLFGPFAEPALTVEIEGRIASGGVSDRVECRAIVLPDAEIESCLRGVEIVDGAVESYELSIDDDLAITEAESLLDITTMFVSSWNLTLRSPAGTEVRLHDFLNGFDGDFRLLYDDDGIENGVPYDCECAQQPLGPGGMDEFDSERTAGVWTLSATTLLAGGTMNLWCLRFDGCDLEAPTDLACATVTDAVELTWINGGDYDSVEVFEDDVLIATLDGAETEYTRVDPAVGQHRYEVIAVRDSDLCLATAGECVASVGIVEACVEDALVTETSFALSIDVTPSVEIVDVDVSLLYNTLLLPDSMSLVSPAGTTVVLHDDPVLSFGMFLVYDDDGGPNMFPFNCTGCRMVPAGPGELEDFGGELSDGAWSLEIETGLAGGILQEVCLVITEGVFLGVPEFLRGDANADGSVFCLIDALYLLQWAFTGGPPPPCLDAADIDDDGVLIALLDALACLGWQFGSTSPPPAPGPSDCGPDPDGDADGIDCETADAC